MSTAAEIEQFIVGDVAAGRGLESVAHDSDLLADGVIDSLGITELITFLERRYGIKVDDDDIDADNFRSVTGDRRVRRAEGSVREILTELLYEQAEARPEHTALVYRDERIAFADLLERIERVASGLSQRGIGPGDAVGLVLRDDPWFVTSFHAVTALGAIAVPVNPAFKQAELEFNFRGSGVAAVISDERTTGVCERIAAGLDGDVHVISTSSAHGQGRHARRAARRRQRRAAGAARRRGDAASTSSPRVRPDVPSGFRARTGSAPPRRACTRRSA